MKVKSQKIKKPEMLYIWLISRMDVCVRSPSGFRQLESILFLPRSFFSDLLFESPLDCKEIQTVHPEGDQSWVFTGRTDVEAENLILWPPDAKGWIIWKEPDAGKDWRQEEKGTTEDEMVGWHHRLNGHGFG